MEGVHSCMTILTGMGVRESVFKEIFLGASSSYGITEMTRVFARQRNRLNHPSRLTRKNSQNVPKN